MLAGIIASARCFRCCSLSSTLTLVTNQVATGLSLTLLGLGLSGMIGEVFVGMPGVKLPTLYIPGLTDIPFVGKLVFGQDPIFYMSLILVVARVVVPVQDARRPDAALGRRQPRHRRMRSASRSSASAIWR